MIQLTTRRRRLARDVSRAGFVLSAAMLVLTSLAALGGGTPAAAAINAGSLQVITPVGGVLTHGDTTTQFILRTPNAAACAGDSATGGFRIESYMLSASIDPNTLTFDASGPAPGTTGTPFRQPLSSGGNPYVDGNTAVGTGALVGIPTFDFTIWAGSFGVQSVPAGNYNVGLACWDIAHHTLDRYWNVVLTFAAPTSGLTWTTAAAAPPTTTTTVAPGATTTTAPGTTTTTTIATTTSALVTTTSQDPGTTLVDSSAGSDGSLVSTGSSPLILVMWAVLLLFFGRMTILLSRPVRVITVEDR